MVDPAELAERLMQFADEIADPLVCRQPAYGAPGHPHCAGCCYGTGYVVTCAADEAILAAADALIAAADIIRHPETATTGPLPFADYLEQVAPTRRPRPPARLPGTRPWEPSYHRGADPQHVRRPLVSEAHVEAIRALEILRSRLRSMNDARGATLDGAYRDTLDSIRFSIDQHAHLEEDLTS